MRTRSGNTAHGRSGARLNLLLVSVPAILLIAALIPAGAFAALSDYQEGTTATGTCANPDNALTDGGGSADCDPAGENLVLSGFDLQSVVPSGSTSIGFNVEIDGDDNDDGGHGDVALSWDGGTTYTSSLDSLDFDSNSAVIRTVPTSSATDCDSFGRTWAWSELADSSFRVRVTAEGEDLDIDQVRVRACFTEPDPTPTPTPTPTPDPEATPTPTPQGTATASPSGGTGGTTPPPTDVRPASQGGLTETWPAILLVLGTIAFALVRLSPEGRRREP